MAHDVKLDSGRPPLVPVEGRWKKPVGATAIAAAVGLMIIASLLAGNVISTRDNPFFAGVAAFGATASVIAGILLLITPKKKDKED